MDFETLAGIYTYAMDHHAGQNSRLYRLLSKIQFRPGLHDSETFEEIRTGCEHRTTRQGKIARKWRIRCTGCELARINGVIAHEHGCTGKLRYRSIETDDWSQAAEVYRRLKSRNAQ